MCRVWWVACATPATASVGPNRGARRPTRSASPARATTPRPTAPALAGAWSSESMWKIAVSQAGRTTRRPTTRLDSKVGGSERSLPPCAFPARGQTSTASSAAHQQTAPLSRAPDWLLTREAGGAETAARSAAGAQSLQDRGRLEPNLGEAAIPQHLRRDVLRPLAGRAAQQGGQERTVRGLQLADHGGAQLGVSVERPDSRPQRLGAHRRIFVMQAEIDELPKRCGWRPDGVGQNTRNRYRGMAVSISRTADLQRIADRKSTRIRSEYGRIPSVGNVIGPPRAPSPGVRCICPTVPTAKRRGTSLYRV